MSRDSGGGTVGPTAKSQNPPQGSAKPWGGRYTAETAPEVESFTASLPFDRRLWRQDIAGSTAHARMLARQGIISAAECDAITAGLAEISAEIEAGGFPWRLDLEDVHMNIEARLREKIGAAGGKLHTGRSRNDQVALDMHLYVREAVDGLDGDLVALQRALVGQAEANGQLILPGYTHLQRAQPVRLGHHLMAYFFMFQRDRERLAGARHRADMMPLGAGALAGTTFPLDPDQVARELGFGRRYANSMDAVSDRDFIVETLSCCALISVHLSRLGEELVLWSTAEFGYLAMDDAYTTGSSIMPQKRNPVIGELLRGKSGRVVGSLVGVLTVLKGLPLTYNTDMQEDKEGTFDALDTVRSCLRIAAAALETSRFLPGPMLAGVENDFTNATDLADYLAARGLPFRDAHAVAGRAVAVAAARGLVLARLPLDELKALSPLFGPDVFAVLSPEACVERRRSPMGTASGQVREQLALAHRLMDQPAGAGSWVAVNREE
ncbi:MAG: argininosuccinate lyase [Bacillota bacterium]|nr:argininosuccinate lyase [Bacillota bacterium]